MSVRFFSLLLLVSFAVSSVLSCQDYEDCLHNDHRKGNQTLELHVNETELQQSDPYDNGQGLEAGIIFVIVFFSLLFAVCCSCIVCICCHKVTGTPTHGFIIPNSNRGAGVQPQQPVINQYQEQGISAHLFPPDQAQLLSSEYIQEPSHQFPTKYTQGSTDLFPPQYSQLPVQQFPPHPAQLPVQQLPPHPAQLPAQQLPPQPAHNPSQFSPGHPQGQYSPTGQQYCNPEEPPPTYDDSQAHLKY